MSESLRLLGRMDPEYVAAYQECVACEELERQRAAHAKALEKSIADGVNPMAWRIYQVLLLSEARAAHARQQQEQLTREE